MGVGRAVKSTDTNSKMTVSSGGLSPTSGARGASSGDVVATSVWGSASSVGGVASSWWGTASSEEDGSSCCDGPSGGSEGTVIIGQYNMITLIFEV